MSDEHVKWSDEHQERGIDYFKVRGLVFDQETKNAIDELIDRKVIWKLGRVISAGKEALVFHALTRNGEERAVKIYKSLTASFKKRDMYFRTFRDRLRKSIISKTVEWAKKEFKFLTIAHKYIRAPQPYALRRNVLVMEFVGRDGEAAPLIKDAQVKSPTETGNKIITGIIELFKNGGVIHADLSEFNILYFENEPVVIDWGQAVASSHPRADFLLFRDIVRIVTYFRSIGGEVPDPRTIFKECTGHEPSYSIITEVGYF
ncbi:MAG: RIO1 family regulatory kinase/ATPase [Candidatus Korarchaeota archaeon]